jgi:hypothetical protein
MEKRGSDSYRRPEKKEPVTKGYVMPIGIKGMPTAEAHNFEFHIDTRLTELKAIS